MRMHLVLLGGALLAVLSCSAAETRPPNVIILVADTLRADRVGAQAGGRSLTPFLDDLARESYVFHNAIAQSSWTMPSVASMLTSRYQSQLGILKFLQPLAEAELTLIEILQANGYATGGFSANPLTSLENGFHQGFDRFATLLAAEGEARLVTARADAINAAALEWLDDASRATESPVLLYLHYMEPHNPFDPTPESIAQVFGYAVPPDLDEVNRAVPLGKIFMPSEDLMRDIRGVYDSAVRDLDTALAGLFNQLQARRVLDHAIVIFVSDHGEELGDHERIGHGHTLFDELIRVPLFIRLPQQRQGSDVDEIVSLVDLLPTILHWLDIEPPDSLEGQSLEGLLQAHVGEADRWRSAVGLNASPWRRPAERPWQPRPALSEIIRPEGRSWFSIHTRAVTSDAGKLILSDDSEIFYDVGHDPSERRPDALGSSARSELRREMSRFSDRVGEVPDRPSSEPFSEEVMERLRALGYVGPDE